MTDCATCNTTAVLLSKCRPHLPPDLKAEVDNVLSIHDDTMPGPTEDWAKLACEFEIECSMNWKVKEMLKNLVHTFSIDRTRHGLTFAASKIGKKAGIVQYASTVLS